MSDLAIEVERLVKRFGELVAVDGIDLDVPAGTVPGAPRAQRRREDHHRRDPRGAAARHLGRRFASSAAPGPTPPDAPGAASASTLQETRFHERLTVEETLPSSGPSIRAARRWRRPWPGRRWRRSGTRGWEPCPAARSSGSRSRSAWSATRSSSSSTSPPPGSTRSAPRAVGRDRRVARSGPHGRPHHPLHGGGRACSATASSSSITARSSPAGRRRADASLGGEQLIEFAAWPPSPARRSPGCPASAGGASRGETVSPVGRGTARACPRSSASPTSTGASLVRLSTRAATLDDVFLALTGGPWPRRSKDERRQGLAQPPVAAVPDPAAHVPSRAVGHLLGLRVPAPHVHGPRARLPEPGRDPALRRGRGGAGARRGGRCPHRERWARRDGHAPRRGARVAPPREGGPDVVPDSTPRLCSTPPSRTRAPRGCWSSTRSSGPRGGATH